MRKILGCVAVVATGVIVVGEPAPAGEPPTPPPDQKPDLHIGLAGGSMTFGDDEYYVPDGPQGAGFLDEEKEKYIITVQNDGAAPSRYHLHGGRGNDDFKVKYKKGGTNITGAMKKGTYKTPRLEEGDETTLTLKLKLKNPDVGYEFRPSVLAAAAKNPLENDLVFAEFDPEPAG